MKDLCTLQEELREQFYAGELHEDVLEASEDAELFHLERKEQERIMVAKTWCRPSAYGSSYAIVATWGA